MNRLALALLCPLLATGCSAELAVDAPVPDTEAPVNSAIIYDPLYTEVALDLPAGLQDIDVTLKEVTINLTVINTSSIVTLNSSARLSLQGTATPNQPVFYTKDKLPPYYASAQQLVAKDFAPSSHTDVVIPSSQTFLDAVKKPRIWFIVSTNVVGAGVNPRDAQLAKIRLENTVLHVTIGKDFSGLDGALGVGGL